jgi:hypothetical protein
LSNSFDRIPNKLKFFIWDISILEEDNIIGSFCWPFRKKERDKRSSKTDNGCHYKESYHSSICINDSRKKPIEYIDKNWEYRHDGNIGRDKKEKSFYISEHSEKVIVKIIQDPWKESAYFT